MNRRTFLSSAAAVPLAATVPAMAEPLDVWVNHGPVAWEKVGCIGVFASVSDMSGCESDIALAIVQGNQNRDTVAYVRDGDEWVPVENAH